MAETTELSEDILENDLGLGTEMPNLFELFHKEKKEGGDGTIGTGDDDKADDTKGKGAAGSTDEGNKTGAQAQAKLESGTTEKVDSKVLKDFITKSHAGTKSEGASAEDTIKGTGAADNKATQSANAAPGAETFAVLYDHLVEMLDYEKLGDNEKIDSEEKFLELIQKNDEARALNLAETMIAEAFTSNPANKDVAQDLFRHLAAGGDVHDFVATRQNDDISAEYLTTDDKDLKESRARQVLQRFYVATGLEKDAIEKTLKTLETSGTLEAMAETILPQFIKMRDNRKTISTQQAKLRSDQEKQTIRTFNTSIMTAIDGAKEFATFDISNPKEKEKLKTYMFVPTIDDGNGRKVPQYAIDLAKARSNPNFTVFQALTLLNNGLDLDKLATKIETNTKKTLKEKIEAAASGKKLEQPGSNTPAGQGEKQKFVEDFDNLHFLPTN